MSPSAEWCAADDDDEDRYVIPLTADDLEQLDAVDVSP